MGGRDTHLDEVQLRPWVLGPHAQHEGTPGPIDVVHAQHRGAQEARALLSLIVQHAEQRLDSGGEVLHLQGQSRMAARSQEAPSQGDGGGGARWPHPTSGPSDEGQLCFCIPLPTQLPSGGRAR